jgi:diguanylate cyclase
MQAIKRVSERAIAWLHMQALPPSPQNYWLAFACLDGQHAELSRTLDALLDGGVRLKQVEADALYEQFFGRAATALPQLEDQEGADSLRHQTLRLADLAASATAVTGEFSRELESLPGLDVADPIEVRKLVGIALERAQRSERELARTTAEVEQLRQKLETVRGDAERDALTGLPNRRGIDAHLAKLRKAGTPGVLALCDVDRFKSYNDRYGHAVGDRVLKMVAQSLTESLDGHFVGRWGGEEFLVVVALGLDDGAAAVRRAKDDLGRRHFRLRETDEPMGRITFSAGVVALPDAAEEIDAALARADQLLYRAKEDGRDLVLAA